MTLVRFLLALVVCTMSGWAAAAPSAHNGVIDLRGWDFERDGAVNLAGSWGLSWDRFDDPTSSASGTLAVAVPGHWNDVDVAAPEARLLFASRNRRHGPPERDLAASARLACRRSRHQCV